MPGIFFVFLFQSRENEVLDVLDSRQDLYY